MASSSSSSSKPEAEITTIQETEKEDEEEEEEEEVPKVTPSNLSAEKSTPKNVRPPESDEDDRTVSCNKCRPSAREKISIVPLDINGSNPSPNSNNIFKSLFSTLIKKSPKSSAGDSPAAREEQWKLAFSDLSQKLQQANRKRDEALLEASSLKHSMAELEKKLNKLEIYCHDLKSGIEICTSSPHRNPTGKIDTIPVTKWYGPNGTDQEKVVEPFVRAVSDARAAVRQLSRSLTVQLRQMGGKVYERIASLLEPYDVKFSVSKNPRSLLFYLEALLNRAFYEDFEGIGFRKNGSDEILNPIESCAANFESYLELKELSWEEVLTKGTKHFSENFSRFCDRKMSEIVGMLTWNRAWPEVLLQGFFGAAKSVWLVHLLARAVHPGLGIFRVEKEARFEGAYMEDLVGDKVRKLRPSLVRIMVSPGFYVYSNVVKCKVLCRYNQFPDTSS
ncbi:IRK-interacting protein-like [Tasmannia lanceolata]|uniref:IRK-interacting protein-like n=1 Tax=Tasmannia lanceolata TaxID=3420 RepID=UPI0040633E37